MKLFPLKFLVMIEHSNCIITTLQTAVMYSRFAATSEIKCLTKKFPDHLYKYV